MLVIVHPAKVVESLCRSRSERKIQQRWLQRESKRGDRKRKHPIKTSCLLLICCFNEKAWTLAPPRGAEFDVKRPHIKRAGMKIGRPTR